MSEGVKAAGYVRVSTEMQAAEGQSLLEQEAAIRAHCEREGWELLELFTDAGVSGRKDSRPQLDHLFGRLGEFDRLVITELSRLGRRAAGMLDLVERLKAAEVELVAVRQHIDTATATGRMFLTVLASIAEFEAEQLGERVAAASAHRTRAGKHHGRAPIGYRNADGKLEIVPSQAEIVRRIFREAEGGKSQRRIAQDLNRDAVPTTKRSGGGTWTQSSVGAILRNPVYRGAVRMNGEEFPGEHEPIIPATQWRKVEADRIDATRTTNGAGPRPGRDSKGGHLFTRGLLRCGHCGGAMLPRTRSGERAIYQCSGKINHGKDHCPMHDSIAREPIDAAALGFFERVGLDLDATKARLTEAATAQTREAAELVTAAEAEEHRAAAALDRVRRDYTAGEIEAGEWRELKAGLEPEHEAAVAKAAQARARAAEVETAAAAVLDPDGAMAARLDQLRAAVAGKVSASAGDLDSLRLALRRVFERFEIYRTDLPTASDSISAAARAQIAEAFADVPQVAAGDFVLIPIPRPETVEGFEEIWPVLSLREPLDLPNTEQGGLPR